MDEIDYSDDVLDEYIARGLSDTDPNKRMIQNAGMIKSSLGDIKASSSGLTKIKSPSVADSPGMGLLNTDTNANKAADASMGEGGMGAADYMEVATGAIQLGAMASGKNYDTSAEGGGVMSSSSAMTSGAMTGFQAGMATGNPLIAAGGLLVGGAIGGLSQAKAAKDYAKNRRKFNLSNDAVDRAESSETYSMEQGEESLGLLKGLRQKQLGLINS